MVFSWDEDTQELGSKFWFSGRVDLDRVTLDGNGKLDFIVADDITVVEKGD